MENHHILNDQEFETQFEDLSFPSDSFTHEAHLRLAWIHISKYGIRQAIENVCNQIQTYAESKGAYDKYHATVTVAAVRAVYHFMLKSKSDRFEDFITEFPRLKTNFKNLLDAHYGVDIFSSEAAKKQFLEPDLVPFDEMPV